MVTHIPEDSLGKKTILQKKTGRQSDNTLATRSEYSLSEFLENEPDLYSLSDLRIS
jgi:hypothetical protein